MDSLKKKKTAFSLLDDAINAFDQEDFALITKSQVEIKAQAEKPKAQPPLSREQQFAKQARNAQPSQSVLTRKNGTKIFRERKSFKQLLNEYNGRTNSLAPLKSAYSGLGNQSGKIIKPRSALEFESDRIESLEVPNINGKVLRPS